MRKKTVIWSVTLTIGIVIAAIALFKTSFYVYLLWNAPKYPTGLPMQNMVIYKIDPETTLNSLDQGKTDAFMTALENPVYNNVPSLGPPGSFTWNQENYLNVAGALHKFIWKESLENWYLYSEGFSILQCGDISRIDGAGFEFYQRQNNWYYMIHDMSIDLQYGYVYAGDHNSYYTGTWKDIDLGKVEINSPEKALTIAEENGGQEARLTIKDGLECNIDITLQPNVFDHSNWSWQIVYQTDNGTLRIYGITIDPYTGKYEILPSK
jgi:hypothetical protein